MLAPGEMAARTPDEMAARDLRLTPLAAASARLKALSDWLDGTLDPTRNLFAAEDTERAEARDLADRRALAGRNVIAREPEAFEMFGRRGKAWQADVRRVGVEYAREQPPKAGSHYVVIVMRLDREGRKLAKLLCPRLAANGVIPPDETTAAQWAAIPSVEWWGTRDDAHPAAMQSAV